MDNGWKTTTLIMAGLFGAAVPAAARQRDLKPSTWTRLAEVVRPGRGRHRRPRAVVR